MGVNALSSPRLLFGLSMIALIYVSKIFARPKFEHGFPSSARPKDPRSIAVTEHTDLFTRSFSSNGWKVRYTTVQLPMPITVAKTQIGAFYYKLKDLVPGVTQSTLITKQKETIHLGSTGGLWLNIRSDNKALHRSAIAQVINVLIDGAESGWAPLFEAEWLSPDGDGVIYVSLTHGEKGEIPGPVKTQEHVTNSCFSG